MSTPFTIDQFLGVFVAYNAAIWPAQVVGAVLGFVAVTALWFDRRRSSCLILATLALMWLWMAIGYHLLFFSEINPGAVIFAAFFGLQAALLVACALVSPPLSFQPKYDLRSVTGFAAIGYALLIYPALGVWAGHGFMAGPMFGVAPCPTTIFTIGMLILARGRWVAMLSIIPLLWSVVGLAAAIQLDMTEDLGLPVAGLALLIVLVADFLRARRSQQASRPVLGLPTR